ncbi:MAG: hypothetical protein LBS56_06420, partial [Propionibacteriaceae bacterium]|nr:hypothetical protein [Propionibacteriaceae bacterium]
MAWLAAVALAVGGLTLQQGAAAPRAEAVTYKGGWDGVFGPDRLWSSNTPVSTLSERGYSHFAGGWVEPWNGLSERTRYQWMDTNGTINGAGVALYATMGIGPLFKSENDVGIALVSISPDRRLAVIGPRTAGGQLNGVQWSNELTGSDPAGHSCQMSNLYGAEVNKKNGHLYVTGSDQYKRWVWQGDNSAGEVGFASAIFQLKSDQTVTCLATSQGKTAKPKSGKSINRQWQEEFGTSVSGNWTIASDLSIDAYGNFYLWGRNDNNKHALLSLQPPRKSNGDYDAGGQWQYEVLKFFNANVKDDNTGYGMAVMNAKVYIYTSDRYMQEWDIPSGAMGEKGVVWGTDMSDRTDRDMDLASTQIATLQMGAVLQGTVYDDADADGSVSGDPGMPGVEVEIWRQAGSGAPTLHDSVLTEADGSYVAFLPSGADNLYLRVKQPQVDGVNAVQTYASAGSFTGTGAGANTVTPLCRNAGADYAPRSSSGWCGGARADMIDPSDVTNPLAGQLGAAFVTKVSVGSDTADTVADFAFTTAGSYGDAGPAGSWGVDYRTRSTKADAGAFHNSSSVTQVKLGTTNDVYTDGVNHATSNEHPSDDGVFVRFHNGSLGLMQDQLLSAGRSYTLEARVSAGLGGVQNVKVAAWASANNATNAMIGSTAAAVGFGQPDAQGRALAVWDVPAYPSPSGGMSASTLRVSASTQSGITAPDNTTRQYAPQPGTWQANSRAWVSDGEVEDYRYHVTTGQVRVALVSSSVPVTNVGYTVSNAVTTSPSTNSGTLRATTAGEAWTSPAKHSVTNSGAATTVSLTSVPSGQTVVGGSCVDSTSGADPWGPGGLNAANKPVVSGQSITIPANTFTGSWTDLMCTFSLGKAASTSTSEFTLNPASGTAQAGSFVTGTVTVRDSSNFVMPGVTVRLASDHAAVTLKDANGQAITSCATNSQGQCQVRVSSDVAGTYANAVHATIQTTAGGSWVEVGPSNDATRRSPKTVTFTAGPPSSAQSGLSVDPASLPVGGTAQVTVTLRDQHGNAVSGKAAALNVSATAGATLSTAWTESPANSGVYIGTVTSTTPGTYTVQAAPTGATVSATVRFVAS